MLPTYLRKFTTIYSILEPEAVKKLHLLLIVDKTLVAAREVLSLRDDELRKDTGNLS